MNKTSILVLFLGSILFAQGSFFSREGTEIAYKDTIETVAYLEANGFVESDIDFSYPETTHDTINKGTPQATIVINWMVKYRYMYPTDMDISKPNAVLIYLHGNNTFDQSAAMTGIYWTLPYAAKYNIIGVVVASPQSLAGSGVRVWNYDKDPQLLHNLIMKNFDGYIKVDTSNVYYWGASQGSCLLNNYLTRMGGDFSGGTYLQCGCNELTHEDYIAPQAFRDNYRIFVQNSPGDHLYQSGQSAADMHLYSLGVKNVQSNFTTGVGHCSYNPELDDSVMTWMIEKNEVFPATTFEPHWQREHIFADTVKILEAGANDDVYAIAMEGTQNALYKSTDKGITWSRQFVVSGADSVTDMAVMDNGDIFVGAKNGIYRNISGTTSFYQVTSMVSASLWTNGVSLLNKSPTHSLSIWNGYYFVQKSGYFYGWLLGSRGDFRQYETSARAPIFWSQSTGTDGTRFRIFNADSNASTITEVPTSGWNFMNYAAGDQKDNLVVVNTGVDAYHLKFMVSTDGGASFVQRAHPHIHYDSLITLTMDTKILPNGNILIYGSTISYISSDLGQTWTRMKNLRNMNGQMTALSDGTLLSTRANMLFRYIDSPDTTPVVQKPLLPQSTMASVQSFGDRIQVTANTSWTLKIHNAQGKTLWSTQGEGNQSLLPGLQKGVYMIDLKPSQGNRINTTWIK